MAAKKTASRRSTSTARPKSTRGQKRGFPDLVYANASPRSIGGTSMFESPRAAVADDAIAYTSEESMIREAVNRLQVAGFTILGVFAQTINIAGPPGLYEEVFANTLHVEDREVIKGGQVHDVAQFIDSSDTDLPGLIDTSQSSLHDVLEGIAIEEPVYFMADSAFAPTKDYWHLRVPGDISAAVNADRAHRRGITGKGVKVVMVDSGWYRHRYFVRRGYKSAPVVLGPASANPLVDESGHGTGESANLFAVAPDIDFTMVKINFVNSVGAFNTAVALGPDIISNSWGSSVLNPPLSATNQVLAAAIALAWSQGIVVVFSAGNGHIGFPGQHPDVIAAGGVYMEQDESLRASDYASGFSSNVYPGRNVPDVSGLVGMSPGASYIMLPVEPGDDIDTDRAGGNHPPQDETGPNDGWAVFSGTSAAAPQVAGVAALMKQACAKVTPTQIRSMMKSTATDVTVGTNANGNTAGTGYDLATGAGLVDANKAALRARLACLTIQPPIVIGPPIQPIRPIQPPIVVGPVIQPPQRAAAEDANAQIAAYVEAMLRAGYSAADVDAWLGQVAAQQEHGGGLTAQEAAALEEAILDGDDFDL